MTLAALKTPPTPERRYDETSAGRFALEAVGDEYPVKMKFFIDDLEVGEIHHRDLSDLSYVVARAKDIAREKLGARFREV